MRTGLAILAALAVCAAASGQEDEDAGCVDFAAEDAAFDLVGAGALISTAAFAREDARTDFAIFEDGASVALSAGFCTHPFYEMTAGFPVPASQGAAAERMAFLFEVLDVTTGCELGPEGRSALGPAIQALAAGDEFETENGAPVHMDAMFGFYLSLAAQSGQVVATLACEVYGVGD
jgi:hypothetical protein